MTTEDWHLDKRVPVAIFVALALQSGTFVWWASALSQRVATLELRSVEHGNILTGKDNIQEKIVRLDETIKLIYARQNIGLEKL
mgnify:CR=1 FL=1